MHTRIRNLNHTRVMQVEETQLYIENSDKTTSCLVEARFLSPFGWGVAKRIEKFGQSKFIENLQKSRSGMKFILERLRENGYRLHALRNAVPH
ncbi:Protein UPS1, mitochondrial [Neolecta irregularis DAH-3]|uniref:Protein UPS1, mitochondrial n=1 Tax=Neolecta irregularis (strain DAH-3) TaxID=1198029 RepID=A0A1U7LNL9_NEOID|nr:Protein UPS1, mitochondrial [Neolecta irregularis DAH-3]|eukprot:OLL24247.1 Protein UPS1, mitochondrial [Neolecta irregularis DAH-3]